MSFLQEWTYEMQTSALGRQIKEYACFVTLASIGQHQFRQFKYLNRQGVINDLHTPGVITTSVIFCGKPGSYKSELVRFMKRVLEATTECSLYPHDQCTREFLLSTLHEQQLTTTEVVDGKVKFKPVVSTIIIDELINFLNRREYVEPLIGTLNALLDQPPAYAVGTHKRGSEILRRPICNFIAACAPSWFRYLPEALFSGGFAGRCGFYGVPYPTDADRQPRGSVCIDKVESPQRLASYLENNLPPGPLVLTADAIKQYDSWEMEWGKEDAHPLEVLDEWFKRRVIQCVRLAGGIAMAHDRLEVTLGDMEWANVHMRHIEQTLEHVWFEVEGDAPTQHKMLQVALTSKALTLGEIEAIAIRHLRSPLVAQRIIDWWLSHGMLVQSSKERDKWVLHTA
jgi:hypothetical protein